MGLIVLFFLCVLPSARARKEQAEPTPTPAPQAKALFEKAQDAFRQKKYREAKDSLLQLVARFPLEQTIPKSRLLLAQLEEDFEVSLEQFKILAQEYGHRPEGEEAQKNLGARYYLADRYGDAAQTYMDFLKEYPKSVDVPEVRYWLGCSLAALGQDKGAQTQFEKCLKEDKGVKWAPKAVLALGNTLLKQRRYAAALKQYGVLLDNYPKFDEMNQVYLKMGRTYEALGKHAEAYAAYRTLLDKYPKVPETSDASERISVLEQEHPNLVSGRPRTASATPTPAPVPIAETVTASSPIPTVPPTTRPAAPFCVQVGVYSVKKYAELAMGRLKKAGYHPVLLTTKLPATGAPVYKVREGGYASREEAHRAAESMERNLYMKAIVVEEP